MLRLSIVLAGATSSAAAIERLDLQRCDIRRVDGRLVDQSAVAALKEPVIFWGLTDDWPARKRWNAADFGSLYGKIVGFTRDHDQLELRDVDATVDSYLKGVGSNFEDIYSFHNLSSSAAFFVNDYEHADLLRSASVDYTTPSQLEVREVLRVFALERPLAGVALHRHEASWQALVSGRKAWFLLEPSVQTVPLKNPCSFLDEHPPPLARTCILTAGEIMVVPSQWWHATCSLPDEPSIAVGGVGSTAVWPPVFESIRRGSSTDMSMIAATCAHGDGSEALTLPPGDGIFVGGETCLYLAAAFGHVDLVQALVDGGIRVNAQRRDGRTASHEAARRGDLVSLRVLHVGGADFSLTDAAGSTTVHHACSERGRAEVVKYLLAQGVPGSARRLDGRSALHVSCRGHLNPVPVLRVLLQDAAASPSELDDIGMTPLMHCAAAGHARGVGLLLRLGGADAAFARDKANLDALEHAVAGRGDQGVIHRLIGAGLKITDNVLVQAVRLGDPSLLHMLSKFTSAWPQDALLQAARLGHAESVRTLVKFGIPADTASTNTNDGQATSLHLAALGGHLGAVQKLLAAGANPKKNDADGMPALHYAAATGGRVNFERQQKVLLELAGEDGLEAIRNSRTSTGLTVLHIAAMGGDFPLVRWLVSVAGTDMTATDSSGQTPFMVADAGNHSDVVSFLHAMRASSEEL